MGFCSGCGSEVNENSAFCAKCGTKVAENGQQGNQASAGGTSTYANDSATTKKSGNKMIGIAVVGVVCLFVLFLVVKVVSAFAGPAYEKPINYMITGMEKGSYKTLMKAFPDFVEDQFKDIIEYRYDDSKDDFMEDFTESLEDEYGKNIKISFKVKDKEKLDKDDLSDLEDSIKYRYDEKVKIKAAYILEVEMKIKGKKGSDKDKTDMMVYKIGSKWYTNADSMGLY